MSYQPLNCSKVSHPVLQRAFSNADALLFDVFGMFPRDSEPDIDRGGCNFSIVIVLLCIVDGVARDIYPTRLVKDQEKRFKRLLTQKLPWSESNGKWIEIAEAARNLYLELRNPLVHELGQDKVTGARRSGFLEPKIGHWGEIDEEFRNIARIDELNEWNDDWPVLYVQKDIGGSRIKVCCAALYWSVKHMVQDLIDDAAVMASAESYQSQLRR